MPRHGAEPRPLAPQADPAPSFAQLGRLLPAPAGTVTVVHIGWAHPLAQGHLVDADDLARNLKENALPADVAQVDATNYPEFLEHRRLLMAQMMRRYYEAL